MLLQPIASSHGAVVAADRKRIVRVVAVSF